MVLVNLDDLFIYSYIYKLMRFNFVCLRAQILLRGHHQSLFIWFKCRNRKYGMMFLELLCHVIEYF